VGLAFGSGLWETVRMATKPTLTKKGEIYRCSACEWTATMDTTRGKRSQEEKQKQAESYFADHLKQRHSADTAATPKR